MVQQRRSRLRCARAKQREEQRLATYETPPCDAPVQRRSNLLPLSGRRRTCRLVAALLTLTALTVAVGDAAAARTPSHEEREAVLRAVPLVQTLNRKAPTGCVRYTVRISDSGAFSTVALRFAQRNECIQYASNGRFVLRKMRGAWNIVFEGSSAPPCAYAIPPDVIGCTKIGGPAGARLRVARESVTRSGYAPASRTWNEALTFNVLVGTRAATRSARMEQRASFFWGDTLVGTKLAPPGTRIVLWWRGDAIITLRFSSPSLVRTCSASARTVRVVYRPASNALVALDSVPSPGRC